MEKHTSPGGATRNSLGNVRYDLIEPHFLHELAECLHEGAESHGEENWKKGMTREQVVGHMWNHWIKWLEGDRSEPHLGKFVFGVMVLKWQEREGEVVGEEMSPEDFMKYMKRNPDAAILLSDSLRCGEK